MAEYAGYVATPPVNYGEITNGLVSNVIAIDQAKREEQRKTQQEFDKYFDDNTKQIKDFDFSKSQSFNDMISVVGEGSKKVLQEAYKSGSKQAVNRVTANLKTSINNINAATKSINEGFGVIEKATLEGKVSPIGNVYADFYTDAMNFKDGGLMVLPDGTVPYVKYDKDGKIVSQNSFFDPATLTKPGVFIDPNVDYEKDLNTWVDKLGTYQNERGMITTISPKLNPAFEKAKETKIQELTSNDRNTARFLSSVAGYQGYKNEEAMQELINNGVPKDKLIKVDLINGIPQPILTDDQKKQAKLIAEQQIEQRVGIKRTLDEPKSYNPFDALSIYDYKQKQEEMKKMRPIISRVKIANKIYSSNNPSDWGPLKEAARLKGIKDPSITNTNEGYKILYGIPKNKRTRVEIARFNSPSDIYGYTTGKENQIEAAGEYDMGNEYLSVSSQQGAILD